MEKIVKGLLGQVMVSNLVNINKIPNDVALLNVFENCWVWYNDKNLFFRNKGDDAKFYKCPKDVNIYLELKNLI